jgi:hypothetical protein
MRQIEPTDTCSRCGLRKVTRELEDREIKIRLCDDCYWGAEPNATAEAPEGGSRPED